MDNLNEQNVNEEKVKEESEKIKTTITRKLKTL